MISPSFFSTAERCERRAAFSRWGEDFGYTREPQGAGAGFGDELHRDNAEPYLRDGKSPDRLTKAGTLFIEGLPFLPEPKSGGVEGEFVLTVSGVQYTGKIDYRGFLPARAMFMGQHVDVPIVTLDHKTSSNPLEYGLWERADWLNDPQSIIYGARHLIDTKADHAAMRWLYYWTKGRPRAKPSDVVLTKGEIEGRFGEWIHPKAQRLSQLQEQRPHPNELPCNTASCNDFNKLCHWHNECKRTTQEMLEGSLISVEKLRKKKEQKTMTPNPGLGNLGAALAALTGGPQTMGATIPTVANPQPQAPAVVPGLNLAAFSMPAAVAQPVAAVPQAAVPATPMGLNLGAFGNVGAPAIGVNAPESRGPVAVELAPPAVSPIANIPQMSASATPLKIVCEELAQAFARAAARL